MRVLQIARPALGGMRRHLEGLCAGLPSAGVEPLLVWPDDAPAPPDCGAVAPMRACIGARPHPVRDLAAACQCAARARGCDLVHGHGLRGAWVAALASALARRPLIATLHNLAPAGVGPLPRLALRLALGRARAVIAVSQAVLISGAALGIRPGRCRVVPNGIDVARLGGPGGAGWRAAAGVDAGTPLVAAVGRLAPEKGFEILVHAAARLRAAWPGVVVVIAGDGPERGRLEAMVGECGARGAVRFLGEIPCVAPLLAAADVVAVPSIREGQGIAALEAMASRTAVVASRAGGLPETVIDGVTGLLVAPGDPADLAAAIGSLLGDVAARERLAEAARADVEARFTIETMIRRTAEVYRACAG
ncbi:MAG: glycosyltransferase family 4 protein [Chthonomonadales bacterium]|nr:glycosyltransferase family 4 protein [Chthonomonadales bacterium]